MYQTQQTEALSLSVYLYRLVYLLEVYQVICGKSNEGKDTCSKGVIDAL